jgi:hypothetical protein
MHIHPARTRDQSLRLEATRAGKAVSEAIRIHDVMAHPETHGATINPSAEKARAIGLGQPAKKPTNTDLAPRRRIGIWRIAVFFLGSAGTSGVPNGSPPL